MDTMKTEMRRKMNIIFVVAFGYKKPQLKA